MPQTTRIKKGLNIPLAGAPDDSVVAGKPVRTVALLGRDFVGLKPRMSVRPGDRVEAGDPLFVDKRDPDVPYVAPGSGTVAAVNRGQRRALLSVVIDLDENESGVPAYAELAGADVDSLPEDRVREALRRTGLWTALRARPYSKVPRSDSSPRSIFVTAIDTNPLAAEPASVVAGHEKAFETGLRVLTRLGDGPVYLCTAPDWSGPTGDGQRIRHADVRRPASGRARRYAYSCPRSRRRRANRLAYRLPGRCRDRHSVSGGSDLERANDIAGRTGNGESATGQNTTRRQRRRAGGRRTQVQRCRPRGVRIGAQREKRHWAAGVPRSLPRADLRHRGARGATPVRLVQPDCPRLHVHRLLQGPQSTRPRGR